METSFSGVSVIKNLPANARDTRCTFSPWIKKISWRRKWQLTPVFLPGEYHGQRSLVSYSPWGCKELGMTEQLTYFTHSNFVDVIILFFLYIRILRHREVK